MTLKRAPRLSGAQNPVPPSSRAGRVRPTRSEIEAAADLYERFSGHQAERVGRIAKIKQPNVGVVIGDMDFVGYTTVRDGVREKYIHKFHAKDKPLFVVAHDGEKWAVFLVGGNYDFTERGITDASD